MIAYHEQRPVYRHTVSVQQEYLAEVNQATEPGHRPDNIVNHAFLVSVVRPKVLKYLVVIGGPTAVGKTDIAIALAQRWKTVVVSADSRQIYRRMDIGTAKPSKQQLQLVPHFFINHISLTESYSAGRFARECRLVLDDLFTKHDYIVVAGGSGLYLRALLEGFDDLPEVPDEIRTHWTSIYAEHGLGTLQEEIKRRDPDYAQKTDLMNPHRLIRALSVIDASGTTMTALQGHQKQEFPFEVFRIFCNLPRQELYQRIQHRVDAMLQQGLLDEVKSLLPYRNMQAMQTVGYKELIAYLDGTLTYEQAVAKIKQHSCNYAKRQITWFRHQGIWTEVNPPDLQAIISLVEKPASPETPSDDQS